MLIFYLGVGVQILDSRFEVDQQIVKYCQILLDTNKRSQRTLQGKIVFNIFFDYFLR